MGKLFLICNIPDNNWAEKPQVCQDSPQIEWNLGNKDTLLATCLLELFGVTLKVYENITYADKYPNMV